MNVFDNWDMISRYLADESSDKEAEEIEKWVREDHRRKMEMDYLKSIWIASNNMKINVDAIFQDKVSKWEQLEKKMHSLDAAKRVTKDRPAKLHLHKNRKLSPFVLFLRVAAVIALMLGAGVIVSQLLYKADIHVNYADGGDRLTEFSTITNQIAGIKLLDGSNINLSVESNIQIAEDFYEGNREIYLNGHAYFDVASDPSAPFIVQTDNAVIKVTGTDFTVRSYPEDEHLQVVLMNGKVSLMPKVIIEGNEIVSEIQINPGERVLLNKNTGEITVSNVNTKDYLGWIEGRIVFDENSLDEVARELERWFGISFVVQQESLNERKLSAVLDSKSLSNVLEVISQTLDVDFHLENQKIYIGKNS